MVRRAPGGRLLLRPYDRGVRFTAGAGVRRTGRRAGRVVVDGAQGLTPVPVLDRRVDEPGGREEQAGALARRRWPPEFGTARAPLRSTRA